MRHSNRDINQISRFRLGSVIWSTIFLYMFLNLTIIGVVALPNILIAFVRSIAPSDSIRGLNNILMIDPVRGVESALFEILAAIAVVGCTVIVIAYHGPLYRFFRCLNDLWMCGETEIIAITHHYYLSFPARFFVE